MMNPNPAQFGGSFQQPPPPQQKGCLGRNWKWMLPVGCLGLIVAGVLLIGGIFFAAMSAIKSSEVYQGALKVAQTHPAVTERLGQPVKDGWLVKGNIKLDATGGSANLEIPLSGPKNAGTLFVRAVSPEGSWMYERLDLQVGGETVSLLDRNVALPGVDVDADEDANANDDVDVDEPPPAPTPKPVPRAPISGGVLNGKAVSLPKPSYPAVAKAARQTGTVTVQVTIDENGSVISARAVSGPPLLQAAAVQAAYGAKFSPTKLSGQPVKVTGVITYNFQL